jgi:hypothetical protein
LIRKLNGLVLMILGGLIVVGAAVAEVAWLMFCFGTVIVGIFMLFVMPALLIAPFVIGFASGSAIFLAGFNKMMSEDEEEIAEDFARARRIAERKRREKEDLSD